MRVLCPAVLFPRRISIRTYPSTYLSREKVKSAHGPLLTYPARGPIPHMALHFLMQFSGPISYRVSRSTREQGPYLPIERGGEIRTTFLKGPAPSNAIQRAIPCRVSVELGASRRFPIGRCRWEPCEDSYGGGRCKAFVSTSGALSVGASIPRAPFAHAQFAIDEPHHSLRSQIEAHPARTLPSS